MSRHHAPYKKAAAPYIFSRSTKPFCLVSSFYSDMRVLKVGVLALLLPFHMAAATGGATSKEDVQDRSVYRDDKSELNRTNLSRLRLKYNAEVARMYRSENAGSFAMDANVPKATESPAAIAYLKAIDTRLASIDNTLKAMDESDNLSDNDHAYQLNCAVEKEKWLTIKRNVKQGRIVDVLDEFWAFPENLTVREKEEFLQSLREIRQRRKEYDQGQCSNVRPGKMEKKLKASL